MSSLKYFFLLCTLLTLSACCNTAEEEGVKKEIGESGMVGFDAIVAEIESYSLPVMESISNSLDYLQKAPFVPVKYEE